MNESVKFREEDRKYDFHPPLTPDSEPSIAKKYTSRVFTDTVSDRVVQMRLTARSNCEHHRRYPGHYHTASFSLCIRTLIPMTTLKRNQYSCNGAHIKR